MHQEESTIGFLQRTGPSRVRLSRTEGSYPTGRYIPPEGGRMGSDTTVVRISDGDDIRDLGENCTLSSVDTGRGVVTIADWPRFEDALLASTASLHELRVFQCYGFRMHPFLSDLSRLTRLEIIDSSIDVLKQAVLPPSLRHLCILNCGLGRSTILDAKELCGHLTDLECLVIPAQVLTGPGELSHLTKLTTLNISANDRVPSAVSHLTRLECLSVSVRKSDRPPDATGRSETDAITTLTRLRELSLVGLIGGQRLPEEIGRLQALCSLRVDLSWGLLNIPDSIGRLAALTKLSLTYTGVRALPGTICQLPQLRALELRGSRLERLPEQIGALPALSELDISSTQVDTLPASMSRVEYDRICLPRGTIRKLPREFADRPSKRMAEALCKSEQKWPAILDTHRYQRYSQAVLPDTFLGLLPRDIANVVHEYVNPPLCLDAVAVQSDNDRDPPSSDQYDPDVDFYITFLRSRRHVDVDYENSWLMQHQPHLLESDRISAALAGFQ